MHLGKCFAAVCAVTLAASPALAQTPNWVVSWAAGEGSQDRPVGQALGTAGLTYRNNIHMSIGGSQVRIRFSNRFGTEALTIRTPTVAKRSGDTDAINAGTLKSLTFSGANSITIPAGGVRWSDAAPMSVAAGDDLAVSFFLPSQTLNVYTSHFKAFQQSWFGSGNQTSNPSLTGATAYRSWHFVTAADVDAPAGTEAVVAIGDSITDGGGISLNLDNRWPNLLFNRLQSSATTDNLAVVDTGIGSDRILVDGGNDDGRVGSTPALIDRWDYDATALSGVKTIILLEGVNDIAHDSPQSTVISQIETADTNLVNAAHAKGIRVIGGMLTPFNGASATYDTAAHQQMRTQLNNWIKSASSPFDDFIDFPSCTKAAGISPDKWHAGWSDDNLHPNDSGVGPMAGCAVTHF